MSERDDTDRWVRQVNEAARRLEEAASTIHPSAWPEALKDEIERYNRITKRGA